MKSTQRDLFEGEARRDVDIFKVLHISESWRDQFFAEADRLLLDRGHITSMDVLEVVGCPDGNQNAIGAAMRTFAVRNGLVIRNYIKSERPSRHAARVAVWVRKGV